MKKMLVVMSIIIALIIVGYSIFYPTITYKSKARQYFTTPAVQKLVVAASAGKSQDVAESIKEGANPNAVGTDGKITPLLFVLAYRPNTTGLEALLRNGANPNLITGDGNSPLYLVAKAKDPKYLKLFLENGGNPNFALFGNTDQILQVALRDGRWDNAVLLLDHGADINIRDASGFTPIMNLVSLRKYDLIYKLIERGADVHATTPGGTSFASILKKAPELQQSSDQYQWRLKVIQQLTDKGIQLPETK